jgi:hypothetical protein
MGEASSIVNDNNCNPYSLFTFSFYVVCNEYKEKFPACLIVRLSCLLHAEHASARKVDTQSSIYYVFVRLEWNFKETVRYWEYGGSWKHVWIDYFERVVARFNGFHDWNDFVWLGKI